MKRDVMIKKFCNFLTDTDIVIFGSNDLSKETFSLYKPGCLYVTDNFGLAASVGLGMAMCTEKRVFVLVGEGDLLRDFGIVVQISASKCQNMFLVVVNNGIYQNAGGFPNVFSGILSAICTFFNLGCRVFEFKDAFERKDYKGIKHLLDRMTGPVIVLLDVDKNKNNYMGVEVKNNIDEFKELLRDETKKSSLYNPFAIMQELGEQSVLNIKE